MNKEIEFQLTVKKHGSTYTQICDINTANVFSLLYDFLNNISLFTNLLYFDNVVILNI